MKSYLSPLIEYLRGRNAGQLGAMFFFAVALLWVIFGFWKTLLILFMTALGYVVGLTFFQTQERFRYWLDKLFPPGHFR